MTVELSPLEQEFGIGNLRTPLIENVLLLSVDDQVAVYKKSIPELPPNTLQQDLALGKQISEMRYAKKALVGRRRAISNDQRIQLEEIISTGLEAVEKITVPCLHMVIEIATHYYTPGNGIGILELIQRGNEAMVYIAAKKYDYTKGFRFTTYAHWRIRRAMQLGLQREPLLRLPSQLQSESTAVHKAQSKYENEHGELPTAEKLAETTGISAKHIEAIENNKKVQPISFNERDKRGNHDDDEITLLDILEDTTNTSLEDIDEQADLRRILEKACAEAGLTENEIATLNLSFGFTPDQVTYSYREIAPMLQNGFTKKMGVSFQRAGQYESEALDKLRKVLQRETVEEYL